MFKIKPWAIILIQAAIFYMPHLPGGNGLHIFLLGVVTGVFYVFTGSLGYSFLLHFLYNLTGFLFWSNVLNESNLTALYENYLYGLLVLFSLACIILLLWGFVRFAKKHSLCIQSSGKEQPSSP